MGKIKTYLETYPLLVDANKLLEMVLEEIHPVRYLLDNSIDFNPPTKSQLRSFGIFMSSNIQESKNRLPILVAITGNPLYTSTSLMTMGVVSVLIDVLVDVEKVVDHNEWNPSNWFRDVVPGIEHLVILDGGHCPRQLKRRGIIKAW